MTNLSESDWRCPKDGVFHIADLSKPDPLKDKYPCTKCGNAVSEELITAGMANITQKPPKSKASLMVVAAETPPPSLTISDNGQLLIRIYYDGLIEYGPNYRPDEAAKAFWAAMGYHAPGVKA